MFVADTQAWAQVGPGLATPLISWPLLWYYNVFGYNYISAYHNWGALDTMESVEFFNFFKTLNSMTLNFTIVGNITVYNCFMSLVIDFHVVNPLDPRFF